MWLGVTRCHYCKQACAPIYPKITRHAAWGNSFVKVLAGRCLLYLEKKVHILMVIKINTNCLSVK